MSSSIKLHSLKNYDRNLDMCSPQNMEFHVAKVVHELEWKQYWKINEACWVFSPVWTVLFIQQTIIWMQTCCKFEMDGWHQFSGLNKALPKLICQEQTIVDIRLQQYNGHWFTENNSKFSARKKNILIHENHHFYFLKLIKQPQKLIDQTRKWADRCWSSSLIQTNITHKPLAQDILDFMGIKLVSCTPIR